MPLAKRKTTTRRAERFDQADDRGHRGRRHGESERIAKALESISRRLARIEKRQNDTQFSQAELDELFVSLSSNQTASDALQAKLRGAMRAAPAQA